MKKADFKKLAKGQTVTVTGKQDGQTFVDEKGVIKTIDSDEVLVHFSRWRDGHGPRNRQWYFRAHNTRDFNITVIPKVEDAPKPTPVANKRPHGAQEYKGNGEHSWEWAAFNVERLRVPGGWIYRSVYNDIPTQTFVPAPEAMKASV